MSWSERLLTNDLGRMAVTPLGGIAGGMVFFLAPVVSPDARSPPPSIIDDLGNILAGGVVFGGIFIHPAGRDEMPEGVVPYCLSLTRFSRAESKCLADKSNSGS